MACLAKQLGSKNALALASHFVAMDLDHDDPEDEDDFFGRFYDCMIWDYLPEWCLEVAGCILYYAFFVVTEFAYWLAYVQSLHWQLEILIVAYMPLSYMFFNDL